ncbi:MAG: MotA/TolQ/ExbB proton channel family protein [Gammaproteobacteria bacterium]|nr:MotA/TolQ/ExbB proton channel family protein [Gammaproteobacteria bacterium]
MRIKLQEIKKSTVIGLFGGGVLVLGMMLLSPEHIGAFFNIPGLLVVIGGTLAATMVSRPIRDVIRVLRSLPELATDDHPNVEDEIEQLLRVAERYRHGNIRAAEKELAYISNPFLRSGIQLVIDRDPLQNLTKVLQWRITGLRVREQADAQILRTMATLAPAFGMLGTLFGLVHMLSGLGHSGLEEIGATMAFAMAATLYGLLAANLVLKPLAIKMERRTQQRLVAMHMLQEGILLLYDRQHPVLIREALDAYHSHHEDASYQLTKLALVNAA